MNGIEGINDIIDMLGNLNFGEEISYNDITVTDENGEELYFSVTEKMEDGEDIYFLAEKMNKQSKDEFSFAFLKEVDCGGQKDYKFVEDEDTVERLLEMLEVVNLKRKKRIKELKCLMAIENIIINHIKNRPDFSKGEK